MSIRMPLIVSLVLIAAMIAFSAWAWPAIPPEAHIAIHWDIHGQPNGYAPKQIALAFAPALAALLTAIFALWPRIEPRRGNLATGRLAYEAGWLGAVGVVAVAHVLVVMQARGAKLDIAGDVAIALAVLLIVLGNFLGKSRANFFVGVRTPWSLSSDLAWEKSNRLAGRLFVATGLLTLGALALANAQIALIAMGAGIAGSALVAIVASYIYWKRDPDSRPGDGMPE
jgi:uncharacterized membrane protein